MKSLFVESMNIDKVLKIDQEFRTVGITDDLHKINSFESDKELDYDLPTICDSSYANQNILINSAKKFKEVLYELYPIIKKINMSNLLIAGGCVSNIVRNKNHGGDIDFFIYGLTEEEAVQKVQQWIADIAAANKEYEETKKIENKENKDKSKIKKLFNEYRIIRNNNTIVVDLDDELKLQLVFRLYTSISEILHGFDLGSSAIGFDGKTVYATTLGKFCHEHSCNIVDTTRRSTTYEHRLKKYFDRGFNIVLPKLDITKLTTNYFRYGLAEVCELPYFTFSYSKINGNKIILNDFHIRSTITSDYGMDDMPYDSVYYQSFAINLINLINDKDYFYYVCSSETGDNSNFMYSPPRINKGNIISFYDKLRSKLNKKMINTKLIKKYINVVPLETIVVKMLDKEVDTNKYLDTLINEQKKKAIEKLEVVLNKDHSKIPWIIKNPGTQLSGSFNPIIENEEKWYGPYYPVEWPF